MADTDDLNTLGQMIALGAEFISEQDEGSDPPAAKPAMEQIVSQLADLVPGEVAEVEPPEPMEDG